jgi:hypothetical protein
MAPITCKLWIKIALYPRRETWCIPAGKLLIRTLKCLIVKQLIQLGNGSQFNMPQFKTFESEAKLKWTLQSIH